MALCGQAAGKSPQELAEILARTSLEKGSKDNVTACVIALDWIEMPQLLNISGGSNSGICGSPAESEDVAVPMSARPRMESRSEEQVEMDSRLKSKSTIVTSAREDGTRRGSESGSDNTQNTIL